MTKLKIYLDTNICKEHSSLRRRRTFGPSSVILDVFIDHAKALRKNEEALLPKKYEFMVANREKFDFVTSFITEAEVAREMSSAFGVSPEEIESLWTDFTGSLDCKYVGSFLFNSEIAKFAARVPIKIRTLFNFMHLFIAVHEKCYFVTGDKDLIEKSRLLLNDKTAIDYVRFRKLIEEGI